jgi:hypothetical protein
LREAGVASKGKEALFFAGQVKGLAPACDEQKERRFYLRRLVMEIRRFALWIVFLVLTVIAGADRARAASVIREGGKTYIVDQRGERWDITQAQTLGFDPKGFQYGIGRNAFTPLTDSYVRKGGNGLSRLTRVIGVTVGKERRAYRRPSGCVQPPNRREDADDRPHRVDLPEHLRALRPGNEHDVVSVQERA